MFENTPPICANSCIKERYPGYEGLWCKLIMAVTSYAMMKNTVAVIHGPANCGWAVRNFCQTNYCLYYGNEFLHMPTTDIDQNDVISGGINKLITVLKQVDIDYKPEYICVFDTCSTALIGDDIKSAINSIQNTCNAQISYVPSAGFTSPPLGKSISEVSAGYAEIMEKPSETLNNTVNILGQYKEQPADGHHKGGKTCKNRGKYPDDTVELTRLIEEIGLNVHRILIAGTHEYIRTAPMAKVNVINCPTWGIPLAERMKEKFGMPYIRQCIPIGIKPTEKWVMELAKHTEKEKEANEFIKKELEQVMPLFDKTKRLVEGKTALIECGRNSMTAFARPMALAMALEELGMTARLFGLHPVELKAKEDDYRYFIDEGFNPLILDGSYPYQQPVNISLLTEDLGLKSGEYIYFTHDVFPMARGGAFDPSSTAKVETGVHLRRVINAPGRGIGFRGATALYENIIESVMFSGHTQNATLYGRIHGKFSELY